MAFQNNTIFTYIIYVSFQMRNTVQLVINSPNAVNSILFRIRSKFNIIYIYAINVLNILYSLRTQIYVWKLTHPLLLAIKYFFHCINKFICLYKLINKYIINIKIRRIQTIKIYYYFNIFEMHEILYII